jgi:hypothetical protein
MRKVKGHLIPVRTRMRYFLSTVDGVGGHYTDAVRRKVVDLVVRDRLTNDQVIEHLQEEFHLSISVGFIYNGLDRFSEQDAADWTRMVEIDARFETLKRFVDAVHGLFERGISKRTARRRRTLLLGNEAYAGDAHLERAMRRLAVEKFEKMIVFMGYTNLDRTNNHVERGNRSFRMLQKTRYRRRRRRTIRLALELHVLRRWRQHPLHTAQANIPKRLRRRPPRPPSPYRTAA